MLVEDYCKLFENNEIMISYVESAYQSQALWRRSTQLVQVRVQNDPKPEPMLVVWEKINRKLWYCMYQIYNPIDIKNNSR